jgi:hypothetical protein
MIHDWCYFHAYKHTHCVDHNLCTNSNYIHNLCNKNNRIGLILIICIHRNTAHTSILVSESRT